MTTRILTQKNYTKETKSTVSGTVSNEDTVKSDGTNTPSAFTLDKRWAVESTVSLNATVSSSPVVEDTDYTVSTLGNQTIITPLTVWDSGSESDNSVSYSYYRTHLLSDNIISTHRDSDYIYVAQDQGLSVFDIEDTSLYAWIERDGGFTCIHSENNNLWLGTDDSGIFHSYKSSMSESTTASAVYTTGTSPVSIQNNNIRQLHSSNNVLAVATAGSVEVIHNPVPATSSGTVYYRGENTYSVYITSDHLYWAPASTSVALRFKTPVPTANWADSDHDYSLTSTPSTTSNLKNIRAIDVTRDTSEYGGDTVFVGLQNAGVDIISIKDSNPSGSDVKNIRSKNYTYSLVTRDDSSDDYYLRNKSTGSTYSISSRSSSEVNGYMVSSNGELWITFDHTGTSSNLKFRRISLSDGSVISNVYTDATYGKYTIAITENKNGYIFVTGDQTDQDGFYWMERIDPDFTHGAAVDISTGSSYRGVAVLARSDGRIWWVMADYVRIYNEDLSSYTGVLSNGSAGTLGNTDPCTVDLKNYLYIGWSTSIYKYNESGLYTTKSFSYAPYSLCMDIEGMIWIGHASGRVSRFSPYSGTFGNFFFEETNLGVGNIYTITCIPDDSQPGNFVIWLESDDDYIRKLDKNGNILSNVYLGSSWTAITNQNGKDPSGINHQVINRNGVGFAEAFAGSSDNVVGIKAHTFASKNSYLIHVATSAFGDGHEGGYSQYRLDTDELESFVEYKQSKDVEVL